MVAHYDKDKRTNGIICDKCGAVHVDKFRYYSIKVAHIEVDRAVGVNGLKDVDERFLDLDFCEKCWKELEDEVRQTLEKINKTGAWSSSTDKVVHKQKMNP